MKSKKPAKKPQDLTLRNLRALKKTVALLAADVAALDASVILINDRLEDLGGRFAAAQQGIFVADKRAKR